MDENTAPTDRVWGAQGTAEGPLAPSGLNSAIRDQRVGDAACYLGLVEPEMPRRHFTPRQP